MPNPKINYKQISRFKSPWSFKKKLAIFIWEITYYSLFVWTPKPLNTWRIFLLKLFKCKIYGYPIIHPRARILQPWNVTLHDKCALGDRANLYSLGEIEIFENSVIAQEAYLCTGTHNFNSELYELITAKISIKKNTFVGARTFILPGIIIGKDSIIGACSVITKDIGDNKIAKGNPAKVKDR